MTVYGKARCVLWPSAAAAPGVRNEMQQPTMHRRATGQWPRGFNGTPAQTLPQISLNGMGGGM